MADNRGGSAAAIGIMSVIAIIGSVGGIMFSINRPMAQRIDQLERSLASFKTESAGLHAGTTMRMEKDDDRERSDAALMAHLGAEGESEQAAIARLDDSLELMRLWMERHDLRVVALNAAQWERIKALERGVYGKPVRNGSDQ